MQPDPQNVVPVVVPIAEDAGGTLWVGTWGGGLNRYDPDTETFTHFYHDPDNPGDPASLPHDNVYALAPDPGGGLWVGTARGVVRIDASGDADARLTRVDIDVTPFGGNNLTAYALRLDRAGVLWIGSYSYGLLRYDPATGDTRNYPAGPGGLGHPWVLSIFEDTEGTLWVGTAGGGLHRYDADRDAFERFDHDPTDPTSLADHHVRDVFSANEVIALGARVHASGVKNELPPRHLWGNLALALRYADEIRATTGSPGVLTSFYRAPAYNRAVGGATRSLHIAAAATDVVPRTVTPRQWGDAARDLRGSTLSVPAVVKVHTRETVIRAQGLAIVTRQNPPRTTFTVASGIGVYRSFTHTDVRGENRSW